MNYTELTTIRPGLKETVDQNWRKVAHKALQYKCNKKEKQRKTSRVFWKKSVREIFLILQTDKEVGLVADTISNRFNGHKDESDWDPYRNQLPGVFKSNSTTTPEKQDQTNIIYQLFPGVKSNDKFEVSIKTSNTKNINQCFENVAGSDMGSLLTTWGNIFLPLQHDHE